MNQLPQAKRAELKRLLAAGLSRRGIRELTGISTNTISKYARALEVSALCLCGQPAGHQGWCRWRLQFSPARRGWLAEQWEKRGQTTAIATVVDEAYREARALRHRLGRFLWATAFTPTLAYSKCQICGGLAQVLADGSRQGRVFRKRCLSRTELAARKAAHQERRTWRHAKRTLAEIRTHLRQPNSQTAASTPEPTSHE